MLKRILKFVVVLTIVDLLFLAFGHLSIWRGNPFLLYHPDIFDHLSSEQIEREKAGSPTGWPSKPFMRPQPNPLPTSCGSAIGGSFTFADEVSDEEAWPAKLSKAIGCNVDNLGVDGFGLDQSVIYYRESHRTEKFVIIGLSSTMMWINEMASWTFYTRGNDYLPQIQISKPFFQEGPDGRLKYVSRPETTGAAIDKHHAHDVFRAMWTPLAFPYSVSVCRAFYKRWFGTHVADIPISDDAETARHMRSLSWKILRQAYDEFSQKTAVIVVMIPNPEHGFFEATDYTRYVDEIRSALPDACLIDPFVKMRSALNGHSSMADIRSPLGHFTAIGNTALAMAVADGLRSCGIIK